MRYVEFLTKFVRYNIKCRYGKGDKFIATHIFVADFH